MIDEVKPMCLPGTSGSRSRTPGALTRTAPARFASVVQANSRDGQRGADPGNRSNPNVQ